MILKSRLILTIVNLSLIVACGEKKNATSNTDLDSKASIMEASKCKNQEINQLTKNSKEIKPKSLFKDRKGKWILKKIYTNVIVQKRNLNYGTIENKSSTKNVTILGQNEIFEPSGKVNHICLNGDTGLTLKAPLEFQSPNENIDHWAELDSDIFDNATDALSVEINDEYDDENFDLYDYLAPQKLDESNYKVKYTSKTFLNSKNNLLVLGETKFIESWEEQNSETEEKEDFESITYATRLLEYEFQPSTIQNSYSLNFLKEVKSFAEYLNEIEDSYFDEKYFVERMTSVQSAQKKFKIFKEVVLWANSLESASDQYSDIDILTLAEAVAIHGNLKTVGMLKYEYDIAFEIKEMSHDRSLKYAIEKTGLKLRIQLDDAY